MRDYHFHGVLYTSEEQLHELSLRWSIASHLMEISFVAEQGGGCPECLEGLTELQRLTLLRQLGFRVMERWEIDNAPPGGKPEIEQWAWLSGGVHINLTHGFVCSGVRK